MRQKIALDWLLSPNRKFLVGSARILVDGALRPEVHMVLSIKLNQPRGLSSFVCEMEHDSFVHVVAHRRGAADFCRAVVECTRVLALKCVRVSHVELHLFPFPVKGLANEQLPGLTVFLGFGFWIKLDIFWPFCPGLAPCAIR